MNDVVVITSLSSDFDAQLVNVFNREGFDVFVLACKSECKSGSKTCHRLPGIFTILPFDITEAAKVLKEKVGNLDFLLDTTDISLPDDNFTISDGINASVIEETYRKNVLRSMALLENFLPMLDEGKGKRLFYLTSAEASINETHRTDHFGYNMSKAALHQFIQMTRNKLAPKGYTFRVFDPMAGTVAPEAAAESAFNYITRRRGIEQNDPNRDDEDNLVFRDAQGRQHSW